MFDFPACFANGTRSPACAQPFLLRVPDDAGETFLAVTTPAVRTYAGSLDEGVCVPGDALSGDEIEQRIRTALGYVRTPPPKTPRRKA